MKRIFNFFADPGHGWMSVKKQFLNDLGIASQITHYSYQRGGTAYLEEDCDVSVFLAALKKAGIEVDIRQHHTDRQSKIRGYESYSPSQSAFRAVATVCDPRTNEGTNNNPAMEWETSSRNEAARQAENWARDGYWTSVYDQASGEALYDFSPQGGVQRNTPKALA